VTKVDESGSYVMPYVLADQNGWLRSGEDPFEFKVLNTFENMINSVRCAPC
jgi:Ca3427-like PBP